MAEGQAFRMRAVERAPVRERLGADEAPEARPRLAARVREPQEAAD
jgi:hypothetical protein